MDKIVFDRVTFAYPGKEPVLDGLSLTLPADGCAAVTGPSGCGKTTLLRLLAGLERPLAGRITGLDGLNSRKTAVVFQEDRLLPWMSAAENVAVVRRESGARETAAQWLQAVRLDEEAALRPAELSGGMKRRVAIARALAAGPDLLLLDEPFNGLDAALWRDIAGQIRALFRPGSGRLAVLVTHAADQAEALDAEEFPLEPRRGRETGEEPETAAAPLRSPKR